VRHRHGKIGAKHTRIISKQCAQRKDLSDNLPDERREALKSFDKYSVILESNNQEQLIFKHAISTVVISRPSHGHAGMGHAAAGQTAGHANVPGTPAGLAQHAAAPDASDH
jgi:hypothetical protein